MTLSFNVHSTAAVVSKKSWRPPKETRGLRNLYCLAAYLYYL